MNFPKIVLPFILLLLLITIGCNHQPAEPLELNEGEKWKIIPEMMTHIRASEKLFSDYTTSGDTDYKKLAEGISEHNKELIKSCTMKGAAHDELHKFLPAHLKLVASLGKANSPKEASDTIDQLKKSFETFNAYFD